MNFSDVRHKVFRVSDKKDMKVHDDQEIDVLYLAREGIEHEVVEVSPGINLELDDAGELIGVEILNASEILEDIIEPLRIKATSK